MFDFFFFMYQTCAKYSIALGHENNKYLMLRTKLFIHI